VSGHPGLKPGAAKHHAEAFKSPPRRAGSRLANDPHRALAARPPGRASCAIPYWAYAAPGFSPGQHKVVRFLALVKGLLGSSSGDGVELRAIDDADPLGDAGGGPGLLQPAELAAHGLVPQREERAEIALPQPRGHDLELTVR